MRWQLGSAHQAVTRPLKLDSALFFFHTLQGAKSTPTTSLEEKPHHYRAHHLYKEHRADNIRLDSGCLRIAGASNMPSLKWWPSSLRDMSGPIKVCPQHTPGKNCSQENLATAGWIPLDEVGISGTLQGLIFYCWPNNWTKECSKYVSKSNCSAGCPKDKTEVLGTVTTAAALLLLFCP